MNQENLAIPGFSKAQNHVTSSRYWNDLSFSLYGFLHQFVQGQLAVPLSQLTE